MPYNHVDCRGKFVRTKRTKEFEQKNMRPFFERMNGRYGQCCRWPEAAPRLLLHLCPAFSFSPICALNEFVCFELVSLLCTRTSAYRCDATTSVIRRCCCALMPPMAIPSSVLQPESRLFGSVVRSV